MSKSKITPPGYKWKPNTSTVNVKPNVSMPLGIKSRNTTISEPTTLRKSTISNTPSPSNYFAARRDNSIHHRLWVLKAHDGKCQASKYTWTHFLRSKDETPKVLIDFLRFVQRGFHAQVRTVRTDKGTKFLNKTLHEYFAQEDISPLNIQTTPETTSQTPTQAPTVTATEKLNQVETNKENGQVEEDEFINIFDTPDCTSISPAEAEYVSLSACYAQVLWLRTHLKDYGFHFDKVPVYCDSKTTIAISCNPVQHSRIKHIDVKYHFIKEKVEKGSHSLSCNPVQHSRTKHIDVRYHFIKEKVKKGIVELFFVGTEYQLVDLFTKALPEERFNISSDDLTKIELTLEQSQQGVNNDVLCVWIARLRITQMMSDEFCPTEEVQRFDDELRHLKLRDMNIAAYTKRFNELALLCPDAVPNEKKKVELYIKGLPEIIRGETTSS
nr:hypothetical protein [Tanacetum cinerariifolium]